MDIQIEKIPAVSMFIDYGRQVVNFLGAGLFWALISCLFFVVLMMCLKHVLNEESGNEYGKAT